MRRKEGKWRRRRKEGKRKMRRRKKGGRNKNIKCSQNTGKHIKIYILLFQCSDSGLVLRTINALFSVGTRSDYVHCIQQYHHSSSASSNMSVGWKEEDGGEAREVAAMCCVTFHFLSPGVE